MPNEERPRPKETPSDDAIADIIDSTYPPVPPEKIAQKEEEIKNAPQIEVRVKPKKPEPKTMPAMRAIIMIILAALVVIGIFLTLTMVPRIFRDVSNFNGFFGSLFVSKNATTTGNVSPSIIPVPFTNDQNTLENTSNPPIQNSLTTSTPAKLVANVISTDAEGDRMIIRFNVQNIGGITSGTWSFLADLPSGITPQFHSAVQKPLAPKSGVIFTMEFTATQDLPVKITVLQ